jgi:enamine deaminase RidA (YjgF/YER057c/UK114 family)
MGFPEEQLQLLGYELPLAPPAVGAYVPAVCFGNLVVTSGQLPFREGKLLVTGRVGETVTLEQAREAARQCALNALAQLKALLGDLNRIKRLVRLEGYVHCVPDYRAHPEVLNAASELLNAVFGPRGQHTRVALGIHAMPLDAPVQLVLWAEVEPPGP